MKRSELEHIVRAAGAIANDREIVVVGSQSILGQFPNAPVALLASMEADVYPRSAPERSDLIDGSIGEGSLFHECFGYYAEGVDERRIALSNHLPCRNPPAFSRRQTAQPGSRSALSPSPRRSRTPPESPCRGTADIATRAHPARRARAR